jgi:hypothetical protein
MYYVPGEVYTRLKKQKKKREKRAKRGKEIKAMGQRSGRMFLLNKHRLLALPTMSFLCAR